MSNRRLFAPAIVVSACIGLAAGTDAMHPAAQSAAAPQVERIDKNRLRIGSVIIDPARREIVVTGAINPVTVLEFIANTPGGVKAYESALTLDSDAVTFNSALLLIGLDRPKPRPPAQAFEDIVPSGEPLEISIEWMSNGARRRILIDELLFDKETGATIPPASWVYTGSTFLDGGGYRAELDGVLIGFIHSAAPVIERVTSAGVGRYGAIVLNPNLSLAAGTKVTMTIRALAPPR